jgi:PST family polysaccharide transporter
MNLERGAAPTPAPGAPAFVTEGGLGFALLGPPVLQLVRFLGKALLAWFLTTEELGAATLAGLFGLLAQMIALVGLDAALIAVPVLDRGLWRRLTRFQRSSGLVVASLLALAALGAGSAAEDRELARLTLALAPNVWLANLSVLPVALLARRGRFREVLEVEAAGVAGFVLVAWASAAGGAGEWSLIAAWYANSLLALWVASSKVRAQLPAEGDGGSARAVLTTGAHLCGAGLLTFAGDRADGFAVGLGLGRAALGLYEWAQHLAHMALQYASAVGERFLLPWFSHRARAAGLRSAYGEALRVTLTFVLPFQIALAWLAEPLTRGLFPAEWHSAAPLLALFSLGAVARSLEVVGASALKACGRSRAVLALSALRAVSILALAGLLLGEGVRALAAGLVGLHAASAALALNWAGRMPELQPAGGLWSGRSLGFVLAWCGLFLPVAFLLRRAGDSSSIELVLAAGGALGAWIAGRLWLDREALRREWGFVEELRRRLGIPT